MSSRDSYKIPFSTFRFYTRGGRKSEILHQTLAQIYLHTYPKFGPFCGKILVIWGKSLVNLKIRIFYISFRIFYN